MKKKNKSKVRNMRKRIKRLNKMFGWRQLKSSNFSWRYKNKDRRNI
jgi:hypothetical protein